MNQPINRPATLPKAFPRALFPKTGPKAVPNTAPMTTETKMYKAYFLFIIISPIALFDIQHMNALGKSDFIKNKRKSP
jgi:hypothetical protein